MKTDNSVLDNAQTKPVENGLCAERGPCPPPGGGGGGGGGGGRVDAAAQMCISGDSRSAELGGDLSF